MNDSASSLKDRLAADPAIFDCKGPVIVWFRRDLRLHDNPALQAACATGRPVLCIFIDEHNSHDASDPLRADGGATRWWLHHSLKSLDEDLCAKGGKLILFLGNAQDIIAELAKKVAAVAIVWNRRYDEPERTLDGTIKSSLIEKGIVVQSFNGHLIYEPWEVKSKADTPMKVFTPFWRAAQETHPPDAPLRPPGKVDGFAYDGSLPGEKTLDDLKLLPTKPDWSSGLRKEWTPGEAGAKNRLTSFLRDGWKGYADDRNKPAGRSTSKLSPHLKFGEISPRQIWATARHTADADQTQASAKDVSTFFAEIGWREFSYHLLYYFPKLATENFVSKFDSFPWIANTQHLEAWQKGITGYPIVDAGMRQLWQTGWMHNRIRMVTASFLIKHLLIDWRIGEKWFWDTLVDADPASNAASWQWVAGSGADAAPYFRIFNPVTQGLKFDTEGGYVRRFVPEIAQLPNKYIHQPWEAPPEILKAAAIELGKTYPKPIVDHATARQKAMEAFQAL